MAFQGNFLDTYKNLTYKHMMGYKWLHRHCPNQPKYVVKADDDVFVEIFHLYHFVSAIYGPEPKSSLGVHFHSKVDWMLNIWKPTEHIKTLPCFVLAWVSNFLQNEK